MLQIREPEKENECSVQSTDWVRFALAVGLATFCAELSILLKLLRLRTAFKPNGLPRLSKEVYLSCGFS